MCTQINAGKTLLKEWQGKLDELVNIFSGNCNDIHQLTADLSTYKQRFVGVQEKCQYFLPDRNLNIPSPTVMTSQPSKAEKSNVQHENPAKDPAETSFTGLAELNPTSPLGQWGESRNISTMPEDPLSLSDTSMEQGDHSETKENLSNFHPSQPSKAEKSNV